MNIQLNGKPYQTTAITLADLIAAQNLENKRYAIEADGQLIPKSTLADVLVQENMSVEIVIAVGGG